MLPNLKDYQNRSSGDHFEGCGEEGPLRGVFFAEFHPEQGPIMRCQLPRNEELVTRDVFDAISVYIIPKQQLARRTITVNALGFKVLGYPIILEDKKYKRNQFMFNVCFVCYPWSRTVQFEPALKKLADYLVHLEQESQYLTNEENNEDLISILNTIFIDLNTKKECTFEVQGYTIQLKVIRTQVTPPVIRDHDVPVLMVPGLIGSKECDLTTQQIIPCIDGISHVAAISIISGVEDILVKATIQNLVYHRVVKIIPIFQFSNTYCVTPNILKVKDDPQTRDEFLEAANHGSENPVTFRQAFNFVTSLTHGTTVKDLCQRFNIGTKLDLDVIRLIQFLALKGIIRRVHSYPYYDSNRQNQAESQTPKELLDLFDGQRTFDEICCLCEISSKNLENYVERDANVVLIRK